MTSPDGAGLPDDEQVGGWGGDYGPLTQLQKMGEQLVLWPFSRFLGFILNAPPEDFDTLQELFQNLIPAIIRRVLGNLGGLLGSGDAGDLDEDTANDLLANIPIVGDVVKVVQGITTGLSGALAGAAAAMGIRWAQVDSHQTTIEAHTQQLVQLSAALQASAVTQAWISLDVEDMVSFPRILIGLGVGDTSSTGSHTHSVSGSTGSGGASGGAHTHSFSDTSSSSGSHSHSVSNRAAMVNPGKGSLGLVPIPVNRGGSRPRRLKLITAGYGWSLFTIDQWLVGLYVLDTNNMNPDRSTWTVRKVWDGGDRKGEITTGNKEHAFDMGTGLGELAPGQILMGAQLQNSGLIVSTRPIAAIPGAGISQAGTTLLDASFYRLENQNSLPSTISFNSLTRDNDTIPWMAVTTEPIPD